MTPGVEVLWGELSTCTHVYACMCTRMALSCLARFHCSDEERTADGATALFDWLFSTSNRDANRGTNTPPRRVVTRYAYTRSSAV